MSALRIFYAAHPSPNAVAFPDSRLWEHNLYSPLVDLGHEVAKFDYDMTAHFQNLDPAQPRQRAFIEANRPRLEEALLRQIREEHARKPIDVFFSYFYSACARPETIHAISEMGITTVNWYCNGSYQFHLVSEIAPAYDYCLVPEEFRLEDYRKIGANPIYSQEAANPTIYRQYDVPIQYDVAFVGQKYGDRPNYIRALLDAGIDVRVWGPGWRAPQHAIATPSLGERVRALRAPEARSALLRKLTGQARPAPVQSVDIPEAICGAPLGDEELIAMYSRAKINLGFSTCGDTHLNNERIVQVRLRDFEAPMSGAFYVVEYMPELEHFYDVGREIVCYEGPRDLAEKVRYYLTHDDEREEIRLAGQARALRDHTWHRRFETAFTAMGLGAGK